MPEHDEQPTMETPPEPPKKRGRPKRETTHLSEGAADVAREVLSEQAESVKAEAAKAKRETTPKRGRPSKAAKQAEALEEYRMLLLTACSGLNRLAALRAPELAYTPDELDTLATLGAAVAAKHSDKIFLEHAEEIALATALVAISAPKVHAYQARNRQGKGHVSHGFGGHSGEA